MARAAIVTISASAYDLRPPAWTSFFGSSGGIGEIAQGNQRDLDRITEIEQPREEHRQHRHDDQHREQRTQQKAGTTPQGKQVVERGLQPEAEDDRDDAHLQGEDDELLQIHVMSIAERRNRERVVMVHSSWVGACAA